MPPSYSQVEIRIRDIFPSSRFRFQRWNSNPQHLCKLSCCVFSTSKYESGTSPRALYLRYLSVEVRIRQVSWSSPIALSQRRDENPQRSPQALPREYTKGGRFSKGGFSNTNIIIIIIIITIITINIIVFTILIIMITITIIHIIINIIIGKMSRIPDNWEDVADP